MKKQILLISGCQGSGKTTLQRNIFTKWMHRKKQHAVLINFADPVYEMHNFCWGVLNRYGYEKMQAKDGYLLQMLGTEWGRQTVNENVWVDCAKEIIANYKGQGLGHWPDNILFIIGDCRFENEFDAFPAALRVRLQCTESIRKERVSMWRETTEHPSEVALDSYAEQLRFDMHLDTGTIPPNEIADMVMEKLLELKT